MRLEELDAVCRQAAHDLAARGTRPLPPSVVLPLPEATRVTALEDFPDDAPGRFDLVSAFARDVMRPANAPAYGFVAEAQLQGDEGDEGDEGEGGDVAVVVYGARGHPPSVIASPIADDHTLGDFTAPEPLDPTAMPFLSPLQHAVDAATA